MVEAVLGVTRVELVDWFEGGVKLPPTTLSTADVIVRLAQRTNLPKSYFSKVIKVSQSTMSRHGSAKTPVSVDVADAAFQFAELVDRVEHMRGQVAAAAWLARDNPHLGGRSPLEFMTTETGRRRVSRYLDSLEEGAYG
ncbi:antitoxin Xre/MbcA/ParS toxin-binding domain-containing protein [Deinococcus sp.]|uniref:antitoxin Xre/MbcA/ParS toxin-binding domain-containing protein n=1 Tax=Deinococcus sp. TaxID=47478 RepID=UPI002869D557|nr:antitoxin Xre/MbcA/ParS toxin-binding domain-containing protein [Deinococcus sp.]